MLLSSLGFHYCTDYTLHACTNHYCLLLPHGRQHLPYLEGRLDGIVPQPIRCHARSMLLCLAQQVCSGLTHYCGQQLLLQSHFTYRRAQGRVRASATICSITIIGRFELAKQARVIGVDGDVNQTFLFCVYHLQGKRNAAGSTVHLGLCSPRGFLRAHMPT